MDTFAKNLDDDLDLDALMIRVREAALGPGAGGSAEARADGGSANTSAAADGHGTDRGLDLAGVIEAQGQWNEHVRRTLAEVVECLRTLRDDWAESQKAMRQEMERLSAIVDELRTSPRATPGRAASIPAAPGRGARASSRVKRVRKATKRGRRRS